MLRTKCILAPSSPEDGLRMSIMSRHTLNDGTTPHPEITEKSYDVWWSVLAPRAQLIGAYYKRGISWDVFEDKFQAYLHKDAVQTALGAVAATALQMNVTLMCIEETPEQCHRRLVAEACKAIRPEVTLEVS